MKLVPSIALHKGKVSRFVKGDYEKGTIYDKNPLELAKQFEDLGVELIHIVDLDGAKKGTPVNDYLLELISGHTNLKVNYSGGVHTDGDISKVFENGASSVTCSTMAVYEPENFASWLMTYGNEQIVLGADALNGLIRIGGWLKETKIQLMDHIEYFHNRGLKYLKTTDISKDGNLSGPSFDLYDEIHNRFPEIRLYASGGVRNMDDVYRLKDLGLNGVIIGTAYYDGKISNKEIAQFHAKA